ncbi:MAG: metalloregulator ArsR/SmtB family transcription factor [Arenicellales bacterium]
MSREPNVAAVAALMADPARATMLAALMDGWALPAGELAHAANVTPQTASSHLAKLLAGELVVVEAEGRHRYYRLAGTHVAQALEGLAGIHAAESTRRKGLSPGAGKLRFARSCYDHLAGRLGVALAQALEERRLILRAADKQFEVTPEGAEWFAEIGIDVCSVKPIRRGLARQCLDWTERRHHLAGPLGVELLRTLCANSWLRRLKGSRGVQVTPKGDIELRRSLGIDVRALAVEKV